MEIEEAAHESSNLEFKLPCSMIMPKQNTQLKKPTRGKKRGGEMEEETAPPDLAKPGSSRFLNICQALQTKLRNLRDTLLKKKNDKLLRRLRERAGFSSEGGQKPGAYLTQRLFLIFLRYETIYYPVDQQVFQKEMGSEVSAYHIDNSGLEFEDYISLIRERLEAVSSRSEGGKSAKKKSLRRVLLNFTDLTLFSENQLNDLIKFCIEEFVRNEEFSSEINYYFIFPTTANLEYENFNTSEVSVAQIDFAEEKQLFSTFVVDLLLDLSFFPLFGKAVLRDLLVEFQNFNVTFKAIVKRLGALCMDFLKSAREKELEAFYALLVERKAPETLTEKSVRAFLQARKGFIDSLAVFDIILKKHFNYSKGRQERLLHYLIYSEDAFLLPDSFNSDFQTVNYLAKLSQQMAETVENFAKGASKGSLQELINDLKNMPEKTERLLNKKVDKRAKQLMGDKLPPASEAQQHQQASELLRDTMRQFVHLNIKDVYDQLTENYEQFSHSQRSQAFAMIKPDVMGDLVKEIISEKPPGYRVEASMLTKIFFEFGVEIDLSSTYEAFKEEMSKLPKKRRKDEIEMGFVNAVSENKYLGLITESQKRKLKLAKHFFAKSVYFDYSMN